MHPWRPASRLAKSGNRTKQLNLVGAHASNPSRYVIYQE